MNRLCVLVGYKDDLLLDALAVRLDEAKLPAIVFTPDTLGDQCVTIQDGCFWVGTEQVGCIVFRCPPDARFSCGFVPADQQFSDTEVRAVWLAALQLASLCAVNRLDVAAWFGNNRWSSLRRSLLKEGVPMAPLVFGNGAGIDDAYWLPYQSSNLCAAPSEPLQQLFGAALTTSAVHDRYLVMCGTVLGAQAPSSVPSSVLLAKDILQREGVVIAELAVDECEHIIGIDSLPAIPSQYLDRTADAILEGYSAHLHRW